MTLWDYCKSCEKEYCYKCQPYQRINGEFPKCDTCKKKHCNGCNYNICKVERTFDICGKAFCSKECMDSCWEDFDTCSICKKTGCNECVHISECAVEGCTNSNCWECAEKFGDEGGTVHYCDCDGTTCLDHITEIVIEEELEMRRGECAEPDCYECRGRAFTKIFTECEKLRAQLKMNDQAVTGTGGNGNEGSIEACEVECDSSADLAHEERVLPSPNKDTGEVVGRSENNCDACQLQVEQELCFGPECSKRVCKKCTITICNDCGRGVCSAECKEASSYWHVQCGGCDKLTCDECGDGIYGCNFCTKSSCGDCVNASSEYKKKKFRQCNHHNHGQSWTNGKIDENNFELERFCADCGLEQMKEKIRAGQDECVGCKGLLFSELYDEHQALQKALSLDK